MLSRYKNSNQYMIKNFGFIILCLFTLLSGCKTSDEILDDNTDGNVIYYNSFETEHDSIGSENYVGMIYLDDASPSGGKRSLYVSGGCIFPHVILTIPAQTEDGYYQLECWAKVLKGSGSIELSNSSSSENDYSSIGIYFITICTNGKDMIFGKF